MRNKIQALLIELRTSYWFIPLILGVLGLVLSYVIIGLDRAVDANVNSPLVFDGLSNANSARTVLSAIAGSAISTIGIVYSLTMVTLTVASQQFGPLIVSNFLRDVGNQVVMGIFIATFLYNLRTLSVIEDVTLPHFVPELGVIGGIVMSMISIGALIYFIHHISTGIRADNIVGTINEYLIESIQGTPHHNGGRQHAKPTVQHPLAADAGFPADFSQRAVPIESMHSGYIQLMDIEVLLDIACKHDVVLELCYRTGEFVVRGSYLAKVYPPEKLTDALKSEINEAYYVGDRRTKEQDIELLFSQLVAVAIRALSPAINDPYTAMMCMNRLGEAIVEFSRQPRPSALRADSAGVLRLFSKPISLGGIIHLAFDQIYHYGSGDLAVVLHLLKTLRVIGEGMHGEDQAVLRDYAADIKVRSLAIHRSEYALKAIKDAHQAAFAALMD